MNKFENVDVIASLQAVMKQNTTHYQSDFQYDADLFRAAAKSADSMEKTFLWLSRPDGTYCERERDALLRDTAQHLEWSTYGGASETLLAFAVKIDGMERGKVKGSLYQLDYAAHAGHLKEIALPRHHATLTFEDGAKRTCSLQDYPGHQNAIMARYGKIAAVRYEPADAGQLAALLRAEQEGRETLAPGRIGDHIRGLNAGRILDEARRIVADVQRLAAGETVKGAHDSRFFYSVPISRDFLALSTDEDLTRLYTVLPFVKHDICAPEHDGGRFVAIPRDENPGNRRPFLPVRPPSAPTGQKGGGARGRKSGNHQKRKRRNDAMSITVEEMNLISIYHEDTRAGQLARLRAVRPLYLGDPELLSVVDSAARKVEAMTAADFLATAFELTPPVLYAEGETEGAAYGE